MLPNVCFRAFENRLFIRSTRIESSALVGRAECSRKQLPPPTKRSRAPALPRPSIRLVSMRVAVRHRHLSLQKTPFCKSIRHRTTGSKIQKSRVSREILRKTLYGKAPNGHRIKSKVAQSPRRFGDSGPGSDGRQQSSSLEWISPVFFSKSALGRAATPGRMLEATRTPTGPFFEVFFSLCTERHL